MEPKILDRRKFYINGSWVDPREARDLHITNPSTEQICAVISNGSEDDVDCAVAAARSAFPSWSTTPVSERAGLLSRLLEIYLERSDEMASAISLEMGAPISLARKAQVPLGEANIRSSIDVLKSFSFERALNEHATNQQIIYEPVGVCGLITPWNWPISQVTLKVVPALGAGCAVILKPSEVAPLSSVLLAEMIHEVGFPAGVFNLVHGDGVGVGSGLSMHPDIDMVSFTGSTRAGVAVSKNAAETVKRVTLELGGKGANIIFSDADDEAVIRGVQHCFQNSGQSCNAPSRMLVERTIYEDALVTAGQVAEASVVDASVKEGKHIGPVASKVQHDKIQRLISVGIKQGGRLIAGGLGRPENHPVGFFVRPTIFADITPEMSIASEEIFGPVLVMMPFDTEEEAIEMANDTPYGLTNYIQTSDPNRAKRVARKLRSGMVVMNGEALDPSAPFGGYKQSGNGREGGVWGLEEFLEVKAVSGWRA